MKSKPLYKFLRTAYCVCLFSCFFFYSSAFADTWQDVLEGEFDIADTFDHYQDWTGQKGGGLPKYEDGSTGLFTNYEDYTEQRCGDATYFNAIGNHGSAKQVGSKSIRLCHSCGVSYFGLYFGDGTPDSGYSELYTFIRVYFPHNAFPTYIYDPMKGQCDKDPYKLVGHVEGEKYLYTSSNKFCNINVGFTSPYVYNNDPEGFHYGCSAVYYWIGGKNNTLSDLSFAFSHKKDGIRNEKDIYYGPGDRMPPSYTDKLCGIEFYYKLESPAGSDNGIARAWIYDENGNATLLIDKSNITYRNADCAGQLFNRIRFEGNKHTPTTYIYRVGKGMESTFYMDDFIIDDQRVGPKYYDLLEQYDPSDPSDPPDPPVQPKSPTGLRIVKIEGMETPQEPPSGGDTVLRLDFNHYATSATFSSWTSFFVKDYTQSTGYGWDNTGGGTLVFSRDRGVGNDLQRDIHQIQSGRSFLADLDNGAYNVTLYFGDGHYDHPAVDVYAEGGKKLSDIAVQKGVFTSESFEVNVSDGQLNILFQGAPTALNGLEITSR